MDCNIPDDLIFENDDDRRRYLADLARLRKIREESRLQRESEMSHKDISETSADRSAASRPKSKTKAGKRKSKWWVWIVAAVLLVLAACPVYAMFLADGATGMYTIAVFGLDSRDGNTGKGALSDVNMIVQINQDNGEIKLVSIYRDTYVQIQEDDVYHKFNQAYHRGGPEQALWALEHNTDIKADDYAAFTWKAVAEGINLLGGIDLEITDKEFKCINGFITETVNSTGVGSVQLKAPGMQHLDGVQSVAYSRLRLMDNDFKRTERQRKVIALCLEKAQQADLETLVTIAETILPQINTSMSITSLVPLLKNMGNYKIVGSKGWPSENTVKKIKNRGSCVVPATLESNVVSLHQFLNPQPEEYKPSAGVVTSSQHIEKVTGVHRIDPPEAAAEVQVESAASAAAE